MAEPSPKALSPIPVAGPVTVVEGWEVASRRSAAALTAMDCTPALKVLVRAPAGGGVAAWLGVSFGRARRQDGVLVAGSGPGEWMLLASPAAAQGLVARARAEAGSDGLVTVLAVTHGRALVRLSGDGSPYVLAKLCAVDLGDGMTPNGAVFRSSVAAVVADVIRDDRESRRSYLLGCERSFGAYLFGSLLDAGAELDLDTEGFDPSHL
ncbi:hypothetical protein BH18ACT15_BH18ACT15_12560 [soil metagenome]